MEQTSFGSKKEINYINGLRDLVKLINKGRTFITSNPIHLAHVSFFSYTHKFSMRPLSYQQQMSVCTNAC